MMFMNDPKCDLGMLDMDWNTAQEVGVSSPVNSCFRMLLTHYFHRITDATEQRRRDQRK